MDTDKNKGQWFVVQTLSGQENKVRDTIQRQINSGDAIPVYEVNIPTEKVSEVRQGKKTTMTRKFFPGYLLVRMDLYKRNAEGQLQVDEDAWYFIKETQGVIGFIGGGNTPKPLSDTEVDDLFRRSGEVEAVKPKIAFELGEVVRIRNGAFENFEGAIQEIDNARGKLKLMVSIFGRSTPVELEFWQVDREL